MWIFDAFLSPGFGSHCGFSTVSPVSYRSGTESRGFTGARSDGFSNPNHTRRSILTINTQRVSTQSQNYRSRVWRENTTECGSALINPVLPHCDFQFTEFTLLSANQLKLLSLLLDWPPCPGPQKATRFFFLSVKLLIAEMVIFYSNVSDWRLDTIQSTSTCSVNDPVSHILD